MKQYFLILPLLLFMCCTLAAQNKSDSTSVASPATLRTSPIKRGTVINRSQELLPSGESPLKAPSRLQQGSTPQPTPAQVEQPAYSGTGIVGTGGAAYDEVDAWGYPPSSRYINRWYRDISGFRGFMDVGGTIGFGKDANHRYDFYGTFGYQFNPIFFVGVGQGYSLSLNKKESSMPTYMNLRVNFLDADTTPYMDLKGGYSFLEGKGLFLNPNFGLSFAKNKRAWNVGVGYMFQKAEIRAYGKDQHYQYHGATLRITFEFHILKIR